MQFSRVGAYLCATFITGPKHALLQVRLGEGAQELPECEMLPPVRPRSQGPLDQTAIIASVLEGVAAANRHLAANYSVTHVRYVADDSGPEVMYGYMCEKLIAHFYGLPTGIEISHGR